MEPTKLFYIQLLYPKPRDIVSVAIIESLTVNKGTQFRDLDLPDTVQVTLDNTRTRNLKVMWQEGSYDPFATGTHTLVGTILLPSNITNSSSKTAEMNVIITETTIPTVVDSTFGISGNVLGGPYIYSGMVIEANVRPIIKNITFTGTQAENQTLSVTINVENSSGYNIESATIQIIQSDDQLSTNESVVDIITDYDINGSLVTFDYVLVTPGKRIRIQATVLLDGGANPLSVAVSSDFTNVITFAPSPLDVYTDRFEFAGGSLANGIEGRNNLSVVTGNPAYDAINDLIEFNRTESDALIMSRTQNPLNEPNEILIRVRLDELPGVAQVLFSFSTSVYLRVDNNSNWELNNTDAILLPESPDQTNNDAVINTWFWIRAVWNGAGSRIEVYNGTANQAKLMGVTTGAAATGSTSRVASVSAGTFASISLKKLYIRLGSINSATEWNAIKTYLGIV